MGSEELREDFLHCLARGFTKLVIVIKQGAICMDDQFRNEIEEKFVDLWFDFNADNVDLEDLEKAVGGLYSTISNYRENPVASEPQRRKIWNKIKPKGS